MAPPYHAQIRILEEDEPTVALLRLIAATGVSAIGIHPRVPNARSKAPPISSSLFDDGADANLRSNFWLYPPPHGKPPKVNLLPKINTRHDM